MDDSHPYRVTNTRCRIGTVFSPDDGHNSLPETYYKNFARSWIYLQDINVNIIILRHFKLYIENYTLKIIY
jgi:hypothetical protein